MSAKRTFERPVITTYRRDELIVETAFTVPGNSLVPSDRRLKQAFRPLSGPAAFGRLLRLLPV